MSYATQARLAQDNALMTRVSACAATQKMSQPSQWAWDRQWVLATQPGWDEAYSAAITADNADPGGDEAVITDSMILTAVKYIILNKL